LRQEQLLSDDTGIEHTIGVLDTRWEIMKKKGNFLRIAVQAILLTALTLGLVSAFRAVSESGQALAPYSPTCVPTPILWSTDTGTPTITPAPSQQVTPPFSASVTPLPISKITDLSPDVPKEDKGQVVVFHCDGTFELFLTFAGTPAPLLPGDVIVLSAPPDSLMGKTVPQGTAVELPTVTPEGTIIFPPITPPGTPTGWPQPTFVASSTPFRVTQRRPSNRNVRPPTTSDLYFMSDLMGNSLSRHAE